MKRFKFLAILILFTTGSVEGQKMYTTQTGHVSFFAKAPVADVDAHNHKVKISLNASTGELTIDIAMARFQFQNRKMGRDARRNYIEIDKFPQASFVGKITGKIDYDKPGEYPVTATGKLKIHGTPRDVNEKGTVSVQKGKVSIHSQFDVQLKDYNIDTPKILGQEMAADKVQVKLEANLSETSK